MPGWRRSRIPKSKKSGKKRRTKLSRSGPQAKPIGLSTGAAITGADVLLMPTSAGSGPVTYVVKAFQSGVPLGDMLPALVTRSKASLTDTKKYMPFLAGAVITASPRIPIIGILAKPVDKGLKRLSKGKWGL